MLRVGLIERLERPGNPACHLKCLFRRVDGHVPVFDGTILLLPHIALTKMISSTPCYGSNGECRGVTGQTCTNQTLNTILEQKYFIALIALRR